MSKNNTEFYSIHSITPEAIKIQKVTKGLNDGAVILYPTDTGFTLGCRLSDKSAIEKIRRIRKIDDSKSMTFLCDSLTHISEFAIVSNKAFRTIKALIPGPFTFILPATKQVPKFAQNPKRNTAGLRVPKNVLSQNLLKSIGQPIISISAKIPDIGYEADNDEIIDYFSRVVDIVVISEKYSFIGESTIIDMTKDEFEVLREGAGINDLVIARNID